MIKKCLFPAAGYGTRFLPATKAIPKEMLPILNKPLIQYGVEEALQAGCENMAIVTGRGKRALEDHFDISYELESQLKSAGKTERLAEISNVIDAASFTYIRQRQMLGLGHAILSGEPLIGGEAFAVILSDDLCDNPSGKGVLSQMMEIYKKYKCSIVAIEEVPQNEVNKYGVIAGNEMENGLYMVKEMVEKPDINEAPSNLAIIGRYILTPDIFDILRQIKPGKNGEIQITDALLEQCKKGMVLGYKFSGKRYDCGSVEGFVKATNDFYNKLIK